MFAPLPPAPTPVIREPNDGLTPARTRTEFTPGSEQQSIAAPQSNRSSIEARATSGSTQAPATTPATVSAKSESGPVDSRRASNQNPPDRIASGTPAAAPSRTQPPRSTDRFAGETRPESRPESAKSFVAEPPQSPIPTPHMRLEESPTSDRSTAEIFDENSEDEPYEQQEPQPRVSMSRSGTKPVNRISQIIPARSSTGTTGVSNSRPMTTPNSTAVQADQTPRFENSRPATSSSTGTLRPQGSPMVSGPGALQSSLFTTVKSAPQTRVNPIASATTSPVSNSFAVQSQSGRIATSEGLPRTSASGFERRGPDDRGQSVETAQHVATWSPPPPRDFPRPPSVPQDVTTVSSFATKSPVSPSPEKSARVTAASTVDAAHTAETKVQPQQSIATEAVTETEATLPESTREAKSQPRAAREPRYYLNPSSNVVDAPSIGPKAAQLFEAIGVRTVFDLLKINTDQAAEQIANPRITAAVLKDLQAQALLVCRVPELRGHDAQYLVACQVRTAEQLGNCHAETLLIQVQEFLKTTVGQRLQRGGKTPDLAEVQEWINSARGARSLRNE
jgi:predicted flap endonuclease-1-like 5' DNA nuclease